MTNHPPSDGLHDPEVRAVLYPVLDLQYLARLAKRYRAEADAIDRTIAERRAQQRRKP